MRNEDHFSKQAPAYARYRPRYPERLFAYLAALAPGHNLAWDCGTGSGQAALGLVPHFKRVVATDASADQIAHAFRHERIHYRVARAEDAGLDAASVDLITTAQALHWFDLEAFFTEAHRVLKPGGILAAWCYHLTEITPEMDPILARYYFEIVGPYWSPCVSLVNEHYGSIAFPFEECDTPAFTGETRWSLNDALGYLSSWSSTQTFIAEHGYDPTEEIRAALAQAWGNPTRRRLVRWPLYVRVGKKPARDQNT